MGDETARALPWVGFVGDLLHLPLTELPHDLIIAQLRSTFATTAVSYNWAEADGRYGMVLEPVDALDAIAEEFHAWRRGEFYGRHPLISWHLSVGGAQPSTNERVPLAVVSWRERAPIMERSKDVGCDQQLAINVRLGCNLYHSYVLARTGTDFTDGDLAIARQIRRALVGLDREVDVRRRLVGVDRGPVVEAGLTPRELTVVALLAEGLAVPVIGHRLACSPRTIEKHLERIYRKLGVRDRINALRIVREWNLAGNRGAIRTNRDHPRP